jgi:hypothetical protein
MGRAGDGGRRTNREGGRSKAIFELLYAGTNTVPFAQFHDGPPKKTYRAGQIPRKEVYEGSLQTSTKKWENMKI